ncbi:MAG: ABC transporter ATP-binding protein [Rhizobiales bacterium 65-79]|nr:MAG: ABC transporter ATP-binding protein [Rhizobiales bacterium 65-79]
MAKAAKRRKYPPAAPGEVIAVVRRILAENGREYAGTYVTTIICLVAVAASTGFSAWIMRDVVDKVFYKQQYELLGLICGGIMLAFTIRGVASYLQAVLLAKIGNNLVARYQQRMFDHLMRLGVSYFTATRSGQLAARINQNVAGVRDLLSLTLTSVARDAVSVIGLAGVMIFQDPLLSCIALGIAPPLVFAINYLMRRLRRVTREAVEYNSRLIGAMQEATQGIAIVKAFTMEDQLSAKLGVLIEEAEKRSNKIARVSERMSPISEVLAGFAIAGVIGYAGYRAAYHGVPPGSVFAFITALLLAYDPARRLAKVQVGLERALVNARMIYEILDIDPHQRDVDGARDLVVTHAEVRFRDVNFSYAEKMPVLSDVSFTAEAGKMTALVGASGAGKSTLVALLERFYDLDSGTIEIDGQDISKVTKRSLRRSLGYVSQQPYLFEGTIRDNIRYGRPDATDEEIEEAARLAHADEFIRQQEHGYDTLVGENGVTLSGGQRQRLSIARAIVRDAPILVLDEATSALDNESELRVQQALATVMKGRTTIVIAHRLSTVIDADTIVVLEEGRVVEEGPHQVLLAKADGVYARFYRGRHDKGLQLVDDTGDGLKAASPSQRKVAGGAV